MAVTWVERTYSLEPNYSINVVIVLTTMAAADLASKSCGKYQSSSIRDLTVPKFVRFFFSAMQFYATTGCLYGLRRMALVFLHVIVVQGNAFLMTLRRKNLAGHHALIAIYGVALAVGNFMALNEVLLLGVDAAYITVLVGSLGILIRLGPVPSQMNVIQNKYILWTVLGLLVQRLRPTVEGKYHEANLTQLQLRILSVGSLLGVFWLWWHSSVHGYQAKKTQD